MSTVSENIRYLRKLKGYTQEQFAERIGIKRSLLGAYEEARANPNELYLDSMAEVLGVPLEHLLNENLKERGRRLGAGTILKLNNMLPDTGPAEEEQLPVQTSDTSEETPEKGAQMDLFGPVAEKKVSVEHLAGDRDEEKERVEKSVREKDGDFIAMLGVLLAAHPSVRLFSEPEDVPVKGFHLVGRRLDRPEEIENNALYILITKEGKVLFRRAFNQVAIKGTVILSSDFPDKPTLELPVSDLAEVYRYLASLRTDPPSATAPVRQLKELAGQMIKLLGD